MKPQDIFSVPAGSRLFNGLTRDQANDILHALGAETLAVKKGDVIVKQWSKATHHYLVVSGEVHSHYTHTNGRRSVNGVFRSGDSFALVFAFSELKENPSTAVAVRDSVVIRIPIVDIINNELLIGKKERRTYVQNCCDIISQSAFRSRLRAFVLEQPTIEERVRTYLGEKAKHFNTCEFDIPLDRQEFADFIACDRSSLSSVLSKMKEKGLIDFRKNHFRIKAAV